MNEQADQEQLDAMREWWAENGNYVLGGIAAGILIIFGWNRWQTGIAEAEIAASNLYEEVMYAAGLGLLDNAVEPANTLFEEYPSTAYAAQARLALARMYMDSSRDQDAADVLQDLVNTASDSEIAKLGRLRLAKILLYQGKAEEALGLVKDRPESAFTARYNELMGDAYVSMGNYAAAEAAYIAALNDDPAVPTVDASFIQLKLNDLPAPEEVAAAIDAAGIDPPAEETSDELEPAAADTEETLAEPEAE